MKQPPNKKLHLTLMLVGAVALSFFRVNWQVGVMHSGGLNTLRQLFSALLNPRLDGQILQLALLAAWQTFVYALISISLAVVLGLIFGVLASGIVFRSRGLAVFFRGLLGFLRAIHELVWAWLFVAAIGLNPMGAVFAIALPYSGALGKVYADSLISVPKAGIDNLSITGASRWQVLFYGYFPLAFKDILSYTIYRLECAIRSSSVLSFVGLGGLGFEIQLAMQDLNYREIWVFVWALVILVGLVDLWGNRVRLNYALRRIKRLQRSAILIGLFMAVAWLYLFVFEGASLAQIFRSQNAYYLMKFLRGLAGIGEAKPAFLDGALIGQTIQLAWETLLMSLMAIGLAALSIPLTSLLAAKNFSQGLLSGRRSRLSRVVYYLVNLLLIIMRSVPELLWAIILVFLFKPGIFPGALALAIHNFGILGKLGSEVIEDMNEAEIHNLATTGASQGQILAYAILPQVTTKFFNYILYRWEVIIRSTLVVGFVGAGGLGMAFKLAMSFLKYSEISLYMAAYLILVYLADFLSAAARRYIQVIK